MSYSNKDVCQSGANPSLELISTEPKKPPSAKYVHSELIIDVPNLVEDNLSDKALYCGLKRWLHRTNTKEASYSTTIVTRMVAYLRKKPYCYSRSDKRWVLWRTPKRAPLNERFRELQKEEEEESMQEEQQVERLVHPGQEQQACHMEQPDRGHACEQAKQSDQEESPNQPDQPGRIVQQVQQPTSGRNVNEMVHEEKKRSSGPSVEEDTANFFNAIGNSIREMHNIDGLAFDARVFSARFPTDAAVDCICKPGLVILERWAVNAPDVMWSDIKALLEIRRSRSKEAQKDAYRYLAHCVKMVFASQVNRRFVMGATICGDIMTFCIFDRSGYLVSEAFVMNENVERLVRVVCGMLFVDEIRLGYDPTIFRDKGGRIVVKFKGVEYTCAEDPLYVEKCVRGRGTGCFKTIYLGEPAVIKDAWVDDSRSQLEHEILEKVKDVEGIVKLVDYEIVQVPNEDDVLVNDTTSRNRETLMKDALSKTKAKWSEFATRTHQRIMLQPCGGPLEGFANLKELLLAIKDVVKCVQDLLEKRVLHRDISLRNIILAKANPKDPNSRMRGYLIDFDYALDLENQPQAAAKGARTGTLPFMALEMLEEESSNDVPHAYYHDLESIFYILCWICTSQEGPNNTERDRRTFDFNKSKVAKWTGIGMDNPSFENIRHCKAATVLSEPLFITEVLSQFAPYFEPIKPCLLAIRALVVNTGSNCKDPLYLEMLKPRLQALEDARASGRPVDVNVLKDIPNSEREPCDVFDSLYDIIKRTLVGLVEPPLPAGCTPEAKARAKVEEEARKEARQMKFRKYMSIREMQEEQGAFLEAKESKAKEEEGKEEGRDEPIKAPAYPPPTRATSSRTSLHMLKQATMNSMNARNTSSSVPGLTHSGPSDLASGTGSRSIPSSPSSPMTDPQIGPPSMESVGSLRAFNDDDEKSAHGRSTRKAKKASELRKLPQPEGPCIHRPSLDSTMPSSVESTRSKRSSAEILDDDSVTSDSQKRMRLEKL